MKEEIERLEQEISTLSIAVNQFHEAINSLGEFDSMILSAEHDREVERRVTKRLCSYLACNAWFTNHGDILNSMRNLPSLFQEENKDGK